MLGLSIQGIQAEYSVGSENDYFSKVDNNNFHKNVNRKNKKKPMKIEEAEYSHEYSVE